MTDHQPTAFDHRDLDTLLSESSPATSEHGPLREAALEAMARDARPSRGRRVSRPLAIGVGALALVFAGTAGASAAFDWPIGWADDAAAELTYTLPSGAVCTSIVGNVGGPEDAVVAANEFLGREDLFQIVDIDAALVEQNATPSVHVLPDGTEVDAGPGTEYSTPDYEYEHAVDLAVSTAMWDSLEAQGFTVDGMSYEGVLNCPGADLPAWMDSPSD